MLNIGLNLLINIRNHQNLSIYLALSLWLQNFPIQLRDFDLLPYFFQNSPKAIILLEIKSTLEINK